MYDNSLVRCEIIIFLMELFLKLIWEIWRDY